MAGTEHQNRFSFTNEERLKSSKRIESLFSKKSFVQNPIIRIYYQSVESNCAVPAQFAFVAPKKLFSKAVDRNRIKRLLREGVRLQKHEWNSIMQQREQNFIFLLSYQAKTIKSQQEISTNISLLFNKILDK
ncbi:MAG TPA: ribonuclease P protein component [Chitinophagales bacterium]|nr:ribonuclease P protein component [Chitinophagales bacterium]